MTAEKPQDTSSPTGAPSALNAGLGWCPCCRMNTPSLPPAEGSCSICCNHQMHPCYATETLCSTCKNDFRKCVAMSPNVELTGGTMKDKLKNLVSAVENLARIKDGKTLFEQSPTNDEECHQGWVRLNDAMREAKTEL